MTRIAVDRKVFAARLREVVADEPKAFAYDIGVSLSALYNYLNGRIPSTPVLLRIALYTGKPMEWFLGADASDRTLLPSSHAAPVRSLIGAQAEG
ncbi:MAG: helix-turn-helix transcriptional regulator [Candidatus Binatia bacterium]|nr:helix-turn-helix transcriptional regulator [Candidatus Binatia bacterium]